MEQWYLVISLLLPSGNQLDSRLATFTNFMDCSRALPAYEEILYSFDKPDTLTHARLGCYKKPDTPI